jgi:hypothetical protein
MLGVKVQVHTDTAEAVVVDLVATDLAEPDPVMVYIRKHRWDMETIHSIFGMKDLLIVITRLTIVIKLI